MLTRTQIALASLALVGALSGCTAWAPNTAATGLSLFDAPSDPRDEPPLPSSRATPTLDRGSVVRYQSPGNNSIYGPGPYYSSTNQNPAGTNDYAGANGNHFRYPMQPNDATTARGSQIPASAPTAPQNVPRNPNRNQAQPAWGMTTPPRAGTPPATNHVRQIPATTPQGYATPAQAFGAPPPPTTTTAPFTGPAITTPGAPPAGTVIPPQWQGPPPSTIGPNAFGPPIGGNPVLPGMGPALQPQPPLPFTDVIVNVQETQTGRLMFGAAVNSDAGVTGQIVLDEKNFDWRRFPTSVDDFVNGTAFRGGGQGFRLEAMPGNRVQRYMASFTDPYFLDTQWTFNLSGFLFDRNYFDWNEQRLGGRIGVGRRITPDLSLQLSMRLENVEISDPRASAPDLDAVIGDHDLFSGRLAVIQDTRDIPFAPTQGYYLELAFEQVFGSFDYPGGTVDFRRFFLITERPDGSGRHVISFANRLGVTGSQTPIFEREFAGGQNFRGFDFRGATPLSEPGGIAVGGQLSFLGSVEYRFPITADDMIQGVVFCDYGTIEEEIEINADDYRVALGFGLRINVPAMGPAPIAVDFAVPVAREDTDDIRQFSFFVGGGRF